MRAERRRRRLNLENGEVGKGKRKKGSSGRISERRGKDGEEERRVGGEMMRHEGG